MRRTKTRVRWSLLARQDLMEAHKFLRSKNPDAARRFASKVRHTVGQLRDHPRAGPVLEGVPLRGEFRSLIVGHHRVIYRLLDQDAVIFRVWDCRQDPEQIWMTFRRDGS